MHINTTKTEHNYLPLLPTPKKTLQRHKQQQQNDETTLQQTQQFSHCLGFYGRFGKDCTISQGVQRDIRPK